MLRLVPVAAAIELGRCEVETDPWSLDDADDHLRRLGARRHLGRARGSTVGRFPKAS